MALSRRTYWIIGIVAVTAGAAAWYFGREKVAAGPEYTIAPIVRTDIVQSVSSTGQLTPLVSVEVSTQISGLVTEVNVDFNSKVRKGEILAKIDPSTYEQRLRQAEADLAATRASHTLAKLNADRLKGLRDED